MSPKDYLVHTAIKHPDLLEGAVEYAFQFNQIDRNEYRYWMEKVNAIHIKNTEQILKVLAA